MKCADVERILPEIIDGGCDSECESHLKSCSACSQLVEDLRLIASGARQLAETDEPPARVWVNISNQLRAEGIIRDPQTQPVLIPGPKRRPLAWWLAPVAVAILAAGSYQLAHKSSQPGTTQVAQRPAAVQTTSQQPSTLPAVVQTAQGTPAQPASKPTTPSTSNRTVQLAQRQAGRPLGTTARPAATGRVISPPADDDEEFLTEVSQGSPAMRETYEKQLAAVNEEIRDTQAYIRLHPYDLDARQQLQEAYQQKAMLYQMALDRIQ